MSNVRTMLADYLLGTGDLKRNYIKNPIAEKNILNITASGAVVTRNTTNPLTQDADIQIVMDAVNEYAEFGTNSLDRAMKGQNCQVKFDYKLTKGAGATVLVRLMDGSAIASELELIDEADARPVSMNFACSDPSTADYTVRFIQTVATTESILNVTNVYLGKADNISNINQAELYTEAYIQPASNCTYSGVSDTYASFGPDTDCNFLSIEYGKGSPPDTKIPAIKYEHLPAGRYKVTMKFQVQNPTSNGICFFRINDGVSNKGTSMHRQSGTGEYTTQVVSGVFEYDTPQTNKKFELFYLEPAATTCTVPIEDTNRVFQLTVERYPLDSQQVLSVDASQWLVDASISTSNAAIDLGLVDVTTYTEITDSALTLTNNTSKGSTPSVQIPCSGTEVPSSSTCGGDESLGISFEIIKTGLYEVCSSFTHQFNSTSGTNDATFQLVETPTDAQTILQYGGGMASTRSSVGGNIGFPVKTCGTFNFNSVGRKVIRVMYEQNEATTLANSFLLINKTDTNAGDREAFFTVRPITQNQPAVVLANSVSSNGTGPFRIESVTFGGASAATSCTSTPCTLYNETGSWVSSVARNAIGDYTLNIISGIFSSAPNCVIMPSEGRDIGLDAISTATDVSFKARENASNTDGDTFGVIMCMGLKGNG